MKISKSYSCIILSHIFLLGATTAHISLTFPPARKLDLDFLDWVRTKKPCGMPKGKFRTTLEAGSRVNVTWHLAFPHIGGFRIELLDKNENFTMKLSDPSSTDSHVTGDIKAQWHSVMIPDKPCDDCTLRLLRDAKEWKDYGFWSCADISIVKPTDYKEDCLSRGNPNPDGMCACKKGYWGPRCQYKDECDNDNDCGKGKCIDIAGTTLPRKQCFCSPGYHGDRCQLQNKDTLATPENLELSSHEKTILSEEMTVYHKIVSDVSIADKEIEFVLVINGTSYGGIGWRPTTINKTCMFMPAIEEMNIVSRKRRAARGRPQKSNPTLLEPLHMPERIMAEPDSTMNSKRSTKGKKGRKPHPEPETVVAEPEHEPMPEPENVPKRKSETKTNLGPEKPKQVPEPSSEPNSEPEAPSEPTAEPEKLSEPESEASSEIKVTSEPKSEPEASSEPKSEPEAPSEPKSEPEVTSEPKSEPEVSGESKPEPEVSSEPKPEPEVSSEPISEPEATSEPKSKPEVSSEPKSEPEVSSEPEAEPEATSQSKSEPEPETSVEPTSEPKSEPGSSSEPEPEATSEPVPEATSEPKSKRSKRNPFPVPTINTAMEKSVGELNPSVLAEQEPNNENSLLDDVSPFKLENKHTPYSPKHDLMAMGCSDMVIGTAKGMHSRIRDYYTRDMSSPRFDTFYGGTEDLTSATGWEKDGFTTIIFRRKLKTNDPTDHDLTGTMRVIWARGQQTAEKPQWGDFFTHDELKYHGHGQQRGVTFISFP